MTEEQRKEIKRDYENRENSLVDLQTKYKLAKSTITQIAVAEGATPRRPKAYKKRTIVCPKCNNVISIKGAKYCCFCGSDIRSEKDKLIEKVESLMSFEKFLPQNARDDFHSVLLAVIKEFKG